MATDISTGVSWNGRSFSVKMPALLDTPKGTLVEAELTPSTISVVRIREVGTSGWLIGFETPLTHAKLIELKPNTEYEMAVSFKNAAGEGPATSRTVKTGPDGKIGSFAHDLDGRH